MLPVKLIEGRIASDLKANMAAIRDFVEKNEKEKKKIKKLKNLEILEIEKSKASESIDVEAEEVTKAGDPIKEQEDIIIEQSEIIVDDVSPDPVAAEGLSDRKSQKEIIECFDERLSDSIGANEINVNVKDDVDTNMADKSISSVSDIDNIKRERKRDSISNVFGSISRLFIRKGRKLEKTGSGIDQHDSKIDDLRHTNKEDMEKDSKSILASKSLLSGSSISQSKSNDLSDFSTFKNDGAKVGEEQREDIRILMDENEKLKTRIIYLEDEMKKINNVLSEIENLVKF